MLQRVECFRGKKITLNSILLIKYFTNVLTKLTETKREIEKKIHHYNHRF